MIKKYKLIKKYPESEFLGFTVTDENCTGCYKGILGDDIIIFRKEDIENYPEFWEKIKELDYEILELESPVTKLKHTLQSNGKYVPNNLSLDFLLEDSILSMKITKVKRLSDGVEFSIGDLCYPKSKPLNCGKITSFEFCKTGYFRISSESKYYIGINDVVKSKKPLFTTFDGKDIFEGDSYWLVRSDFSLWKELPTHTDNYGNPSPLKAFSTKESAQKYIEENKPKYSKKQILDILNNDFNSDGEVIDELYELIK